MKMNSTDVTHFPDEASPRWARGIFFGTLLLTLVQAAIFGWLVKVPVSLDGSLPRASPVPDRRPPMTLGIGGVRDGYAWLPNPRPFLVQSPVPGGLSSLRTARIDLTPASPLQSSRFLSFDATPPPVAPLIPSPATPPLPIEVPRPYSPQTQRLALTQAEISVSGRLESRPLARPIPVPSWSGAEPLGLTRVEISVNSDGEVVLARVIESCGVKAADQLFLNACRLARFTVLGRVPPGEEFTALTRGRVTLRWPTKA